MKSVPLSSQNTVKFPASLPFSQHSPFICFYEGRLEQTSSPMKNKNNGDYVNALPLALNGCPT